MKFEAINKELKIAACGLADLTMEQVQSFLKQWEEGAGIETLTLFYGMESGYVVLKVDNPDRRLLNQITEIMNNSITGWKRSGTHRFPGIGQQKCYIKTREFIEPYEEETPFT